MKKLCNFKKIPAVLALSCSFLILTGCKNDNPEVKDELITYTDLLNREVKVKKDIERVVCIGASALRLYSYVGDLSKLCGVEKYEVGNQDKVPVRPYSYAYKEDFKKLEAINSGGPMQPANPEAIMAVEPDVVFSLYNNVEEMNNLEKLIKVPVVCLSYGNSDPFSNDVYESLDLIGKIVGTLDRSTSIINYIKSLKKDLNDRTKDIVDENKPSVYLGYNTYNAGKGTIGDSIVNYTCFKETNAKNVLLNQNFPTNNVQLTLEKLIELNPSMMFVDVMNIDKLVADYKNNEIKENLMHIDAFKNNNIYIQMPFNQYYTNIDIAIADCYYIGKTMFPENFKDIDVTNKYNEILSTLLNKNLDYYQRTIQDTNTGFSKLDLNSIK